MRLFTPASPRRSLRRAAPPPSPPLLPSLSPAGRPPELPPPPRAARVPGSPLPRSATPGRAGGEARPGWDGGRRPRWAPPEVICGPLPARRPRAAPAPEMCPGRAWRGRLPALRGPAPASKKKTQNHAFGSFFTKRVARCFYEVGLVPKYGRPARSPKPHGTGAGAAGGIDVEFGG